MGEHTTIEWTDATWNPIRGCSKVSDGCRNCYAMRQAHRTSGPGGAYEGLTRILGSGPTWTGEVRFVPDLLEQPLWWRKPRRIFVNSMSDLFHESVDEDTLDRIFAVMALCSQHTFQVLTKRPARMREYFANPGLRTEQIGIEAEQLGGLDRYTEDMKPRWPLPLTNVWLGVSVENQVAADERVPELLATPSAVRWLSCEPLLGPVDLNVTPPPYGMIAINGATPADLSGCLPRWQQRPMRAKLRAGVDWVVAGGESGPHARPMHPDWVRSLRDQCQGASVPFFFKQWGNWVNSGASVDTSVHSPGCTFIKLDGTRHTYDDATPYDATDAQMWRVSKHAAGRALDGRTWDEYPR